MDFGFGIRIRKTVAHVLLVCCFSFLLAGCDYTTYPDSLNVRWVSTDPDFTLEYRQATSKRPYELIEYLSFNEEQLFVNVLYLPDNFIVVPANATDLQTVFLRGSWELLNEALVFYIAEDNLFGGIYEEIHFTRENIE